MNQSPKFSFGRIFVSCLISVPLATGTVWLIDGNATATAVVIGVLFGWIVNGLVRKVMPS